MASQRAIRHVLDMELHSPSWLERLVLRFLRLEKVTGPAGSIWYKSFADRLYIYRRELKEPLQLKVPFTGGANTPWLN